jgi:hypothetical protein
MKRKVGTCAALLAAALLVAGCSVFGMRGDTETPDYEVGRTLAGGVEIRRYGERLAAETAVEATAGARNDAFRRLADYIYGDNQADRKIAMTAPVATAAQPPGEGERLPAPVATAARGGELVMRFFLPSAIEPGEAPQPQDPRVRLVEVPAETLAVLRFSGRPSDDRVAEKTDELLAALAGAGIEPAGKPQAFFYDPPWTLPPMRRNEVAVPVDVAAEG